MVACEWGDRCSFDICGSPAVLPCQVDSGASSSPLLLFLIDLCRLLVSCKTIPRLIDSTSSTRCYRRDLYPPSRWRATRALPCSRRLSLLRWNWARVWAFRLSALWTRSGTFMAFLNRLSHRKKAVQWKTRPKKDRDLKPKLARVWVRFELNHNTKYGRPGVSPIISFFLSPPPSLLQSCPPS